MQPNQPNQTPQPPAEPMLRGERQTGFVPHANGEGGTLHAISSDGMKYGRVSGEPFSSAAEFYGTRPGATEAEKAAWEQQQAARAQQGQKGGNFLTRWLHRG